MFSETVDLRGHIIDSLILPKVLDQILTRGGDFKIGEIKIGQNRADQSFARIEVSGPTHEVARRYCAAAAAARRRGHGESGRATGARARGWGFPTGLLRHDQPANLYHA